MRLFFFSVVACFVLTLRRQDEHEGASPLQLLRRVREGGMWWLLVEYDDEYETQGWKGFADEAAVVEFSQVNVGEPLEIPPVSLSPDESATVVRSASDRPRGPWSLVVVVRRPSLGKSVNCHPPPPKNVKVN